MKLGYFHRSLLASSKDDDDMITTLGWTLALLHEQVWQDEMCTSLPQLLIQFAPTDCNSCCHQSITGNWFLSKKPRCQTRGLVRFVGFFLNQNDDGSNNPFSGSSFWTVLTQLGVPSLPCNGAHLVDAAMDNNYTQPYQALLLLLLQTHDSFDHDSFP